METKTEIRESARRLANHAKSLHRAVRPNTIKGWSEYLQDYMATYQTDLNEAEKYFRGFMNDMMKLAYKVAKKGY